MGARSALIVGVGTYADARLRQLRAPAQDADALAEVLSNPEIGDFDVQLAADPSEGVLRRRLSRFFSDRRRDDLLLVHLSCHGIKHEDGQLYFAAADTEIDDLDATGVASDWLKRLMDRCASQRIVLMLDCCHSGAFGRGMLARSGGVSVDTKEHLEGRGRAILTASDAVEYAFEGDSVSGQGTASIFTSAIVDALRTGAADRDRDGWISIEELHRYVHDAVRGMTPNMTPRMWTLDVQGALLIARSPRGAVVEPASLPEELRTALESPRPRVRESAVEELAELLVSRTPGLALAAQITLGDVAQQDVPRVAGAARRALDEAEVQLRREAEEQTRREREEQTRREHEEQTRREHEEQTRREHEEQTRPGAEEQTRPGAEEQTRRAAEATAGKSAEPRSKKATASLCVGIIAMVPLLGLLVAPAAIILGRQARKEIRSAHDLRGNQMAEVGIALGWIAIPWTLIIILVA